MVIWMSQLHCHIHIYNYTLSLYYITGLQDSPFLIITWVVMHRHDTMFTRHLPHNYMQQSHHHFAAQRLVKYSSLDTTAACEIDTTCSITQCGISCGHYPMSNSISHIHQRQQVGIYTQLMNNVIVEYSYYTWLYVTVCSVILSTIMLGSLKVTVNQLIMH